MTFILGIIVGILLASIAGLTGAWMARTGHSPQKLSTLVLDKLMPSQGYAVEPDVSEDFANNLVEKV